VQYKLQVCLQLHTSADNVTLLAFAADRRAAVRRRLPQQSTAAPTAANPPHAAAAVDRWTGRTDCRGTARRTDSVPLRRPCRIIARPVSIMLLLFLLLCPDRGAAYGDERVCLSACVCVCVCVCLFTIISSELYARFSPNFCACYLWLWLGPSLAA